MSDAVAATEARRPRARKPRSNERPARRSTDVSLLTEYLSTLDLGVNPSIHVNGHSFQMALVTVDFGQPIKSIKLTPEQNQEFTDRLRKVGREILGRDGVRVSHDNTCGLVYYASAV
ncbi:MAG: hypothetical protein EOP83_21825 [Verrucomicrobiaceae bacterium]|nr:MAG: hypothetical protein EOP83_21825 [Verrucomicrobiaceae bacterium]